MRELRPTKALLLASSLLVAVSLACSCSDGTSAEPPTLAPDAEVAPVADGGVDASPLPDGGADAAPPKALTTCPISGPGALVAMSPCFTFTAEQAGASKAGDNATKPEYALEPSGTAKAGLVVQLNGSLGTPAGQIADPAKNIYNAAAQAGFHIIGLAYKSTTVVGQLCNNDGPCFGATRKTLVLGVYQSGAAPVLKGILVDEGIVARLDAAIRLLAASRPTGGWDQYLSDPGAAEAQQRIAWGKIIASGHSQGGGHAAYLGQMFGLRKVVQLSSTCDHVGGVPAPWTLASETWATPPATKSVGFAAPTLFTGDQPTGGDTTCPYHAAVWSGMGVDPSRQHDDAATCGAGANTHGASIGCVANFARWSALFD
jgi:hypothetical protein